MTPEEFDYLHEHYRFYIDTTDYCRGTIQRLDSGWFGLLEGFLKYMEPEVGEPRSLLIGVQKSAGALHVRTCNTSTRINGLAQQRPGIGRGLMLLLFRGTEYDGQS